MRFISLVFLMVGVFSATQYDFPQIPELKDETFDEILEKHSSTPLILNFYVETCNERSNANLNLLSTWHALYKEMNGDFYRFYGMNMEKNPKTANRLGIFESPTLAVIENKKIYYYKGALKNFDVLKEFFSKYKEMNSATEIPNTHSVFKNVIKFLKSRLEMFGALYEYNTSQFYSWLILTFLHFIGVVFAWRLYDQHVDKMSKKTKVQ